jgi:TRAP-type C4-dicarboxylate transport system substrate-binding protein
MRPTIALIAALAAALVASAGQAKEFRSSDVHPLGYPTVQAVMCMAKLIGERTGGKHGVKVFGQSTLGSEKDTIEQTRIGALDMVRVNVAPFNNIVPATIVPSLPFLFKSTAHMRRVLDGPVGDEILAAMASQCFIGLCFHDSGSCSFYSGKKAIRNVADSKGMKIRVQQSDMWVAMMQAIVRAAAKESVPHMRKLWDEREASARKTVGAAGTQVVSDVDKKSFSDAMAPVYAKFAADPELQDPVKRIEAAD